MIAPGTILVADRGAFGGNGGIIAIDPATAAQESISSGGVFVNPSAVVVEGAGSLLVVDSDAFGGTGGVIRLNPSSGTQTPLAQGGLLVNPFAAAIEAGGAIVVAATLGTRLVRIDPATGQQSKVLARETLDSAVDVAVDRDGSLLVVANVEAGGELVRVDRATGEATPVAGADFQNLVGIALAHDGAIWVLEDRHGVGPSVVHFDPVTRRRTLLTSLGLLHGPFRIALEAGGRLVVSVPNVDEGNGLLVRIDTATGQQTILAEGGLLVEPFGIAVV